MQGQELFSVPMRLALSEVWPKEDSYPACSAVLPHTRLAAKLLRQKALGSSSAWQPYIAVRLQLFIYPLRRDYIQWC